MQTTTQGKTIGGHGTDSDKSSGHKTGDIHATSIACSESGAFAGKNGAHAIDSGDSDRCSEK
jgi:hypothetical protein